MRAACLAPIAAALAMVFPQPSSAAATRGGATVAQLDQSDPMTWLVKSVCVTARNQLLRVDPYVGCPSGASIRKLNPGEPLPYHNIEQMGYQQRDAFSAPDPRNGQNWIIATYDYAPFNYFNLSNQTDGYDVIAVQNGWASVINTSDGGGYGQSFFTTNCTLGNAWVLFPASNFESGGQTTVAIADAYWEQSDQNYPGNCPRKYSTTTQTSWKHQKGFRFGGINGSPAKTMDAMISYHGFQPSAGFLQSGHMEVFYFTREYGVTRWEVWTPTQQRPTQTTECAVSGTEVYHNVNFVVQSCHDWSNISSPLPAQPQLPIWPIPNLNLLANPHFVGAVGWTSAGGITAQPAVSTASRDIAFSPIGVGYVALSCGSLCSPDYGVALYQDVPGSSFVASGTYGFGVNARTDPSQCTAPCDGTIGVQVRQLDGGGSVLSQQTAQAAVASDNGTAPSQGEPQSVYLSAAFLSGSLTIDPNAATIRFLIAPQSPQTFDVLDAWLAPWPAPTAW